VHHFAARTLADGERPVGERDDLAAVVRVGGERPAGLDAENGFQPPPTANITAPPSWELPGKST
jgi:hypothetical protein